MKKILIISCLMCISLCVSAQDKDLEAQYLYTQGEEAFTRGLYPECINFCEQAALKLGANNSKILTLEIQAYDELLIKKCTHPLITDHSKIENTLKYYFANFSNSAEKEKLFKVMKFRDNWNNFKRNGCPPKKNITVEDLNLGITFTQTKKGPSNFSFPVLDPLQDGMFKIKTQIREGFLLQSFYLEAIPCSSPQPANSVCVVQIEYNDSRAGHMVASDFQNILNSFISNLQNNNPNMESIKLSLYGGYRPSDMWKGNGKNLTFEVIVPVPSN